MKIYSIGAIYNTRPIQVGKNTRKSHINQNTPSFGHNMTEAERKKAISDYLKYKDLARIYVSDNNEQIYKDSVADRIDSLRNKRAYKGWFSGATKLGKVKKLERLRIEKEEYENYLATKAKCRDILANDSFYKSLINTEDIEVYEIAKKLLMDNFSLNNVIAGYDEQKEELKRMVIEPIQRENLCSSTEKLPPAILLYGPIGCGKSKIAEFVGKEANCNVLKLNPNTSPRKFTGEVKSLLNEARKYYLAQKLLVDSKYEAHEYKSGNLQQKAEYAATLKSPRTIIVIDEVDKYFNPNSENSSDDIADMNKTFLKGILDHCSEIPDTNGATDAAGVTFFFTTNFPTRVDSEISLRNGKCTRLPVSMPDNNDIQNILKFYLDNYSNQKIREAINNGKDLKLVNTEQIPYKSYVTIAAPNKKNGALTGAGIERAVKQATENYIDNKDRYINLQLAQMLTGAKYRVSPEKLDEYQKEIELMGKKYKDIDEKEEFELLSDLDKLDMITDSQKIRLEYLKGIYSLEKKDIL